MKLKSVVKKITPSYSIKPCRKPTEEEQKDIARLNMYVKGELVNGTEHPISTSYLKIFSDFGVAGNETAEFIIPFDEPVSIPLGLALEIDSLKVREIGFQPHKKATDKGIYGGGDKMVILNSHPRCRFVRYPEG